MLEYITQSHIFASQMLVFWLKSLHLSTLVSDAADSISVSANKSRSNTTVAAIQVFVTPKLPTLLEMVKAKLLAIAWL